MKLAGSTSLSPGRYSRRNSYRRRSLGCRIANGPDRRRQRQLGIALREQFQVARGQGTERPFCGTLLDNLSHGVYTCVCCGLPLFASNAKFDSGTGWPSFFQPIADENVATRPDRSHGTLRVEILCPRCDGHLGHVFPDGPPPTGRRHCVNSESLVFTDVDDLASLADPAAQ